MPWAIPREFQAQFPRRVSGQHGFRRPGFLTTGRLSHVLAKTAISPESIQYAFGKPRRHLEHEHSPRTRLRPNWTARGSSPLYRRPGAACLGRLGQFPPCSSDGLGAGVRATIPFLQDGPVPGINNNMGLGLGADYAHRWANHCTGIVSANGLIIPVVLQWNFFLLRRLSVFGEAGVAWQHWWNTPYLCTFCGGYTSTNQLDVALAAGGRFMVTERFAFLLRLGWPYVSLGAVISLSGERRWQSWFRRHSPSRSRSPRQPQRSRQSRR